jgi:nitroreductase
MPARLGAISSDRAALKPAPEAWSPKEELGHLIDSASHNHQRIVRAALSNHPSLQGYDGEEWVRLNKYRYRDWPGLIHLWAAFNQQLLAAAEAIAPDDWNRTCTIGDSEPMTIAFVADDYVRHMIHHLRHIGVDVDDIDVAAEPSEAATSTGFAYPEKPAPADRLINELMERRWSPRAFEPERAVERDKILTLLEAARWAPSCFNEQPWRYLVFDGSDAEALERARSCLVEGNGWARSAPVLMLSVACETFARNGKPNRHAQHDVGLASENLVLEAVELGLAAHQMAGYDADRARAEFQIPDGFTPMAMIAIGYPYRGELSELDEKLRNSELAGRQRKPHGDIAFNGRWGAPYS